MVKLFLTVLNMSITGAFVVAAIMLARFPLKKAPKIISYALWAVVGFNLVCPFKFESAFSLIPFKSALSADLLDKTIVIEPGESILVSALVDKADVHYYLGDSADMIERFSHPLDSVIQTGVKLWLIGVALMLIYSAISIVLLKRGLRGAALAEDNVYEADNLKTPFVVGLFRPRIYIPKELSDEERRYIVLHERTHIQRCDHLVKMFAYFVLCLHWFNPLAWAAFILMGADMEMSCDERVMKERGVDIRGAYAMSLVRVAAGRRILNGSPLAFGEGGMKERIKNVLNFKKHSRVIVIAAVTLVVAMTAGFSVSRAENETPPNPTLNPAPTSAPTLDAELIDLELSLAPTSTPTPDAQHTAEPPTPAPPSKLTLSVYPQSYAMVMSSTPGLRLDVSYPGDYSYVEFSAGTGGFIHLEDSIITNLGNSVTVDASAAIYWRPNLDEPQGDTVQVRLLDESGELINGGVLKIVYENGYFSLAL